MAAVTSRIPLEVIELIIDNLENDKSLSSIKACSLVSSMLLPRARKYIFGSVVINGGHCAACTPQMFASLIAQTPEISNYVTSLNYFVKQEDLTAASFGTALNSLTKLKSLTIRPPSSISWGDMPLREAILNLMHLPTLSHLKLHFFHGFYLSDLILCAGLKSLEMFGFSPLEGGRNIEMYQEQPPRLESYVGRGHHYPSDGLLMRFCTARRTDGKPVVDISGLKALSLGVAFDELDAIQEWFKICTQLEEVHLSSAYC